MGQLMKIRSKILVLYVKHSNMVSGIPQVLPTTVYKWGTFREEDSLLDNQHNGSKNNCLYLIAGVRVAGGFESPNAIGPVLNN
jgi:hypothetical protein